ncbi:hypothetical protein ACFE04_011307 [Oxalis oulophora]
MADVVPYVEEHMRIVRQKATSSRKGLLWVQNEHGRTFASWFVKKVSEEIDDPRCVIRDTMVDDIQLFVTGNNTFDRGGDDIDDEPNCVGVGEGTLLRKSGKRKLTMSMT